MSKSGNSPHHVSMITRRNKNTMKNKLRNKNFQLSYEEAMEELDEQKESDKHILYWMNPDEAD